MFLRRIRAQVQRQDWTAIVLDLVIVVLGVFIATEVSNWNQSRRDAERGRAYLERIHGDLESDAATLAGRQVFWGRVIDYGNAALGYADTGTLRNGSAWQTLLAFYQASQIWPYSPTDATFMELKGAGELGLIQDPELRSALAFYYIDGGGRIRSEFNVVPRYREDLRGLTPSTVQRHIWSRCHRAPAHRQELIDCESPVSEAGAQAILDSFLAAPEVLRGLRFWITNLEVTTGVSHIDRDAALALAERIKDYLGVEPAP